MNKQPGFNGLVLTVNGASCELIQPCGATILWRDQAFTRPCRGAPAQDLAVTLPDLRIHFPSRTIRPQSKDHRNIRILHSGSHVQDKGGVQKSSFVGSLCLCGLWGPVSWGATIGFESASSKRVRLLRSSLGGSLASIADFMGYGGERACRACVGSLLKGD